MVNSSPSNSEHCQDLPLEFPWLFLCGLSLWSLLLDKRKKINIHIYIYLNHRRDFWRSDSPASHSKKAYQQQIRLDMFLIKQVLKISKDWKSMISRAPFSKNALPSKMKVLYQLSKIIDYSAWHLTYQVVSLGSHHWKAVSSSVKQID